MRRPWPVLTLVWTTPTCKPGWPPAQKCPLPLPRCMRCTPPRSRPGAVAYAPQTACAAAGRRCSPRHVLELAEQIRRRAADAAVRLNGDAHQLLPIRPTVAVVLAAFAGLNGRCSRVPGARGGAAGRRGARMSRLVCTPRDPGCTAHRHGGCHNPLRVLRGVREALLPQPLARCTHRRPRQQTGCACAALAWSWTFRP